MDEIPNIVKDALESRKQFEQNPPDFKPPSPRPGIDISDIEIPDPRKGYRAEDYHERLMKMIQVFEDKLDNQHEVGARLVNFGQTVVFHLKNIGYCNPCMIRFYGETDSGEPIELIQHISQISIMLVRMKRLDPDKPKTKIGFLQEDEE